MVTRARAPQQVDVFSKKQPKRNREGYEVTPPGPPGPPTAVAASTCGGGRGCFPVCEDDRNTLSYILTARLRRDANWLSIHRTAPRRRCRPPARRGASGVLSCVAAWRQDEVEANQGMHKTVPLAEFVKRCVK